ncbi:hypothetical protein [Actinomadura sp. CNU-125]|uniref:hypothetical protein n=1 Tax=Actinomadura sp. CNU-125 TaxID=1904961 RepID=UPI0021CC56F8|nr:hypothetical protein [Actinomadura sp. CNU-125]
MIAVTLAASPRRGRVLAAKAAVIAAAGLAAGLAAALGALAATDAGGLPVPDLTDGTVLRALAGTGLLMSAVAVLALAVAVIVRPHRPGDRGRAARAAGAADRGVRAAGLDGALAGAAHAGGGVRRAADRPALRHRDRAWAGLGVLCAYAAVALAAAAWLLRRRDA